MSFPPFGWGGKPQNACPLSAQQEGKCVGSTRRWAQRGDATEHNNAKKEGNAKGDNLHPKQSESDCLGLVVVAFVLVGAVAGGDGAIVSVESEKPWLHVLPTIQVAGASSKLCVRQAHSKRGILWRAPGGGGNAETKVEGKSREML